MAAAASTEEITPKRNVIIQPMLQNDANNFTVLEGLRLRTMLVKFFFEGFDIPIEASGMTRGEVLDLYLAEEGTPSEVARLVKGEDHIDKDIERLKRLKYLAQMSKDGIWGDQIMLIAFSEVFKQPVHVYQIDTSSAMRGFMAYSRKPKLFLVTTFGDSYSDVDPMPVLYDHSHYSALLPKVDTVFEPAPVAPTATGTEPATNDAAAPIEAGAAPIEAAVEEMAPITVAAATESAAAAATESAAAAATESAAAAATESAAAAATESAAAEILLNRDLFLLNVPGDGNCLFTSLRLAMEIKNTRRQLEANPDLFDPVVFKRLVGKSVNST
jgi:hypothetical protein